MGKDNKIYNAIQKGMANALVIEDSDSHVNYKKAGIDNGNVPVMENIDQLNDLYFDVDCTDEIFNMKYDTKYCLSVILENGYEISLYEYKEGMKPVFLKISDKRLVDDIYLACMNNHYVREEIWQTKQMQILPDDLLTDCKMAEADMDGYGKCQEILKIIKRKPELGDVPAIRYCNGVKTELPGYKGYLPAAGELSFVLKYMDLLNFVFYKMHCDNINLDLDDWWTCSEFSMLSALDLENGVFHRYGKSTFTYNVLPFFRCIK